MQQLSAFDIIGPNMIGPSSSHTAGAVRIARLAIKDLKGKITNVVFTLYGSFADTYKGHGTDRALIAGILGSDPASITIRDAYDAAARAGLSYRFVEDHTTAAKHPNTVDVEVQTDAGEKVKVTGVSYGGGIAGLV